MVANEGQGNLDRQTVMGVFVGGRMALTRQILLEAIKKKPLPMNKCSLCGYQCCFVFKEDQLGYDSGCYCVSYDGWAPEYETALDFYLDPVNGHVGNLEKFVKETLTEQRNVRRIK